jgi:hypothetical protein
MSPVRGRPSATQPKLARTAHSEPHLSGKAAGVGTPDMLSITQRPWLIVPAIVAGTALIIPSTTMSGEHRYWPWLALLALGGRAATAIYALLTRRRG